MEPFEIPRWEQAKQEFAQEFRRGYGEGKAALSTGAEQRRSDVSSVFYVDVPLDDVLDGLHQRHLGLFYAAGRDAALASRRTGEAVLDDGTVHPDSREARFDSRLRWVVRLNS